LPVAALHESLHGTLETWNRQDWICASISRDDASRRSDRASEHPIKGAALAIDSPMEVEIAALKRENAFLRVEAQE
jgi:hypothetical protein